MLIFCRDYFQRLERERLEAIARRAAWLMEWGGRKGEVKAIFDRIDTNGGGTITTDELSAWLNGSAIDEFGSFFGFSGGGDTPAADAPENEELPTWLIDPHWLESERAEIAKGSGPLALFEALDTDRSGAISWEGVRQWMDQGFDREEELKKLRAQRDFQLAQLAAAEEARRKAEEEAAAAEAARLAAEEVCAHSPRACNVPARHTAC
eukprot:5487099-Prymnesium_polylepis.2